MYRLLGVFGAFALLAPFAQAQTTQGIILGRVIDSVTGLGVATASVTCISDETSLVSSASVDAQGNYAIPSLSPGRYVITISAPQYQTQQARALDIPVAGRVELNIRMRPLYDVWEAGQYRSRLLPGSQQALGYYGPDVDTSRVAIFNANRGIATPLENSLSNVVAQVAIDNLPLIGRDVYTTLLLLPGVTADTATARGLGFSVNGQRPSASNYLLDGAENNNLLVTGPLSAVTPDFIQEYRVSTANYSAEYGRTSGFLANAISRNGTNQWHGRGYFYFKNDRLNANGFQENANGIARPPFTEILPGGVLSGPVLRNRLFIAGGFQQLHSHGRGDPQPFALPTAGFIASTDPNSYAGQLLRRFRPEISPTGPGTFGLATIAPANGFDRSNGFVRADYTASSRAQLFFRAALDRFRQRDLVGNPYPDFPTQFRQGSLSLAAGLVARLSATSQNELRISRTGDSIRLATPHSEVPTLVDDERVTLPGAASAYDYRNTGRTWEFLDNWTRVTGRHAFKIGAGLLQRNIDLGIRVYPKGYLQFATLSDFSQNRIELLLAEFDRLSPAHEPVAPLRAYRYRQFYGFAQDSFHWSDRLTFDYGLRYEFFGSPVNTGAQKDLLIRLAHANEIRGSVAGAVQALSPGGPVYTSRPSNWSVRGGVAWDPLGTGRTILRASYGIFYDRLFDNLWENVIQNRYSTGVWKNYDQPVQLTLPLAQLEAAGEFQDFSELIAAVAFQPNLRAPRTQSVFMGVQQALTPELFLEVHGLASRGRQLITTDQVNRQFSAPATGGNLTGYLNPAIPNYINYRANEGSSNYGGLVTALRLRKARLHGQISYTWSHSIDNQSESLAGTFLDFNNFAAARQGGDRFISSFTRQFASGLDRGSSDFDQRHNLVFFFTYQTAGSKWIRDWTVSGLGAARSGLPFTVFAPFSVSTFPPEYFINQRADLIRPADVYLSQPIAGGRRLLNPAAFARPGPNVIGTSGRNAFSGPGLFNADASLARTFSLGESRRLTLRADFYNAINHANLNNPSSFLGADSFGAAQYGRREINSGFPLLSPLSETARQIQVLLRLEF